MYYLNKVDPTVFNSRAYVNICIKPLFSIPLILESAFVILCQLNIPLYHL